MGNTLKVPKFERMRKEVGYECKVKKIRHSVICNHYDRGWTYYIDGTQVRGFTNRDDAMDFAKAHVQALVCGHEDFRWAGVRFKVA